MGSHLIHIYENRETDYQLSHYICCQKLSEMEIFQMFITPPKFKNRIDFHMRPCKDPVEVEAPHYKCRFYIRYKEMLDLRPLATSFEIKKEATKLLYSTNTFSFDELNILKRWLSTVPTHLLTHVQHLNIEMPLHGRKTIEVEKIFDAAGWTSFFSTDLHIRLPNIKSLTITLFMQGLVTCWHNSKKRQIMDTFRPLRQLKHLRTFTVLINEDRRHDRHLHEPCADREHDKTPRYSFWERKELRRVWAEEIREMVLGDC